MKNRARIVGWRVFEMDKSGNFAEGRDPKDFTVHAEAKQHVATLQEKIDELKDRKESQFDEVRREDDFDNEDDLDEEEPDEPADEDDELEHTTSFVIFLLIKDDDDPPSTPAPDELHPEQTGRIDWASYHNAETLGAFLQKLPCSNCRGHDYLPDARQDADAIRNRRMAEERVYVCSDCLEPLGN